MLFNDINIMFDLDYYKKLKIKEDNEKYIALAKTTFYFPKNLATFKYDIKRLNDRDFIDAIINKFHPDFYHSIYNTY